MKTALLKAILLVIMLTTVAGIAQGRPGRALAAADGFRSSPVMFVENAGQWDDRARFQLWGGPATMWLADDAIWLIVVERGSDETPRATSVRLSFDGANPNARLVPYDRLDTAISYFRGNDPAQWRAAVPVWGGVRYVNLYPGVDLVATETNGRPALRLDARPGADTSRVRLRVEGAESANVADGFLSIDTPAGAAALPLLGPEDAAGATAVQPLGGNAFAVAAPFASGGSSDGPSSIESGDSPLADNPADLLMGTLIGGVGLDDGADIQVNSAGQAYVTGTADVYGSPQSFPTTPGAWDTTGNGGERDVFVAKVAADGKSLVYATLLGGKGRDHGLALALDGAGNVYVTGHTASSDFPTTAGAHRRTWNNSKDGFVTKLNPAGSGLVYSTYAGGTDAASEGRGIAVDGSGNAHIVGITDSYNLPTTTGAWDDDYNAGTDAFVLKFNAAGSAVLYGTYLGGNGKEDGMAIAVSGGDIFVGGYTESANYPTTAGAWDSARGGYFDAFVARFHPAGNGAADLVYSTYLGGRNGEQLFGLAIDGAGNAHVAGWTQSPDYPTTPGAYDRKTFTDYDHHIFVTRLNPSGTALTYSTLMGGRYSDMAYDLALDTAGNIYVAGKTQSDNFPTTPGAFQESDRDSSPGYGYDVFVAKFKPAGSGVADLIYSSYLGGNDANDEADGIAVDSSGKVYMTGLTQANNFPTTKDAFDRSFNGFTDAFVVKLGLANSAPLTCYPLTLSHTGQGGNPTTGPARTDGCPTGQYSAGQWVVLTAAPAPGWRVKDWSGTDNNSSTANTNGATMLAGPHTVTVNYEAAPAGAHKAYVGAVFGGK